jgi:hypothetical protein
VDNSLSQFISITRCRILHLSAPLVYL